MTLSAAAVHVANSTKNKKSLPINEGMGSLDLLHNFVSGAKPYEFVRFGSCAYAKDWNAVFLLDASNKPHGFLGTEQLKFRTRSS